MHTIGNQHLLQRVSRWASRVPTCTEQPQNASGQCQTRGYSRESWKVTANVWGFQLLFPIPAAFLSHPLSKVQSRKSWAPHICLSLPCTQKCGHCQQYKKEKPKCLSHEVSMFLGGKENTTGTGSHRTGKERSHILLLGKGKVIICLWRQLDSEVFKTFKSPFDLVVYFFLKDNQQWRILFRIVYHTVYNSENLETASTSKNGKSPGTMRQTLKISRQIFNMRKVTYLVKACYKTLCILWCHGYL